MHNVMKQFFSKKGSRLIVGAIVLVGLLLAYNVYQLTQLNKVDESQMIQPFFTNVKIQYEEKKLPESGGEELETRSYEVSFDENGHFTSEVIAGPSKGSKAVWDGKTYIEYNESGEEVATREADSGAVAPHPFLSRSTNEQLRKWLDEDALGASEGEITLVNRIAQAFVKKETVQQVPEEWLEKYPTIFSDGENTERVTYYIDVDERVLLAAESTNNGKLFHSVRMTSFEPL